MLTKEMIKITLTKNLNKYFDGKYSIGESHEMEMLGVCEILSNMYQFVIDGKVRIDMPMVPVCRGVDASGKEYYVFADGKGNNEFTLYAFELKSEHEHKNGKNKKSNNGFEDGMEVTSSDGYTRILSRWTKNGKDRVYINGGSKTGDGFVDLVTGEIHLYNTTNYAKEIAEMIVEMFKTDDMDAKIENIAEQERALSELRQAYRECVAAYKTDLKNNGNDLAQNRIDSNIYTIFKIGTKKMIEDNEITEKYPIIKSVVNKYDIKIGMDYQTFLRKVKR